MDDEVGGTRSVWTQRQVAALETLAESSRRAAAALELGVVLGALHAIDLHPGSTPGLKDKLTEGYKPIVQRMLAQVLEAQGFESPDLGEVGS